MINFLSSLVSYLVLLIFLAILFELIMPQKSFKRYVQMIFGLLLILAIISPLARVRGVELDSSNVFSFYESGGLPPLEQIMEWGKEMEQENTSQTLIILEKNITKEVDRLLKERFDMKVEQSEIKFRERLEEADFGSIRLLRLYVAPNRENGIEPVERINIAESNDLDHRIEEESNYAQLEREIKDWVKAYLSLDEEQVEIIVLMD